MAALLACLRGKTHDGCPSCVDVFNDDGRLIFVLDGNLQTNVSLPPDSVAELRDLLVSWLAKPKAGG